MHRTPLPRIIFLVLICTFFLPAAFGQAKPAEELVVTKCWSYPLTESPGVAMASDGSNVFVSLSGAKIEALSLDGRKIWASELGGEIASNLLPLEVGVFVVTATGAADGGKSGGGVLRALSTETGITTWTLKLPGAERHFLSGFNGSVIVVSKSGVIQSVDAKTGLVKWKREIAEGFVASPVFNGGKVLVAASGKQIFGISSATGEIDSLRKLPFSVTALGETAAGELLGGDERGNVTSFANGHDKVSWKFKTGGEISGVYGVGDGLLVTSHDNFVYFMTGRNGDVVWKKRLAGRVSHIASVFNKYAVITSFEEHLVLLMELSSGKVAGQIVFGPDEYLVADPVNWSTEGSSVSGAGRPVQGPILILTNQASYAFSVSGACR